MTTPDYKALCAELAEQLDSALDYTVSSDTRRHSKALIDRARAALAEGAGATDRRAGEFDRRKHNRSWVARDRRIVLHGRRWSDAPALAEGAGVVVADEDAIARMVYERALWASAFEEVQRSWPSWEDLPDSQARDCAFNTARAILARLDATHPRPIPVAERPWEREGFCDAEGRCWFGWPESYGNDEGGAAGWMLMHPDHRSPGDPYACPAAAIPLP
jgi:hypothetical protein